MDSATRAAVTTNRLFEKLAGNDGLEFRVIGVALDARSALIVTVSHCSFAEGTTSLTEYLLATGTFEEMLELGRRFWNAGDQDDQTEALASYLVSPK